MKDRRSVHDCRRRREGAKADLGDGRQRQPRREVREEAIQGLPHRPQDDPDCRSPEDDDIISTPHSNSFLDLNGDCMPDIFLQKTGVVNNTKGTKGKAYHNYYEIYTQRQHRGQQMYCLLDSNAGMHVLSKQPVGNRHEQVPLIEFVDIDRDGMIDMFFYYKSKIYVYYNKLKRK